MAPPPGRCSGLTTHGEVDHRLARFDDVPVDRFELRPQVGHDLSHRPARVTFYRSAVDRRQPFVHPNVSEFAIHETESNWGICLESLEQTQRLDRLPLRLTQLFFSVPLTLNVSRCTYPSDGSVFSVANGHPAARMPAKLAVCAA